MNAMSVPTAPFRFCPRCATACTAAATREFRCAHCGFRYFHNVAAAVAAFVVCDGALLVTRRAHAPAAGTLDLPGGFVDPGESFEQALARELAEELGWTSLPGTPRYLCSTPNAYPFANVTYATCDGFFEIVCAQRPIIAPNSEISAALWVVCDEIAPRAFGLPSVRAAIVHWRAGRRTASSDFR
jgi:NADH pyrophosphatase NudC (nudix superfamily)